MRKKIIWSTSDYEGYSLSTMLIGDLDGHRAISSYNSHWYFPFAQLSLWWAKKLISWQLNSLNS